MEFKVEPIEFTILKSEEIKKRNENLKEPESYFSYRNTLKKVINLVSTNEYKKIIQKEDKYIDIDGIKNLIEKNIKENK